MEEIRSKIIKGSKDRKGNVRKFISIPEVFYDEFEFGDIVRIRKIERKKSKQES
jgi:hypothetical protein